MPKKEKQDGKLTAWIKAKWEALCEWYRKPDNVLRVVRFPGTKLPLLDVLIDFFKFFTKVDDFSEGLGLGLPLTRRHVENLGGKFWLDNDYHDGCRFIFEFPL